MERPLSGLTQPELLALDFAYEPPFYQRKPRHVSVRDRVSIIKCLENDQLQARNNELNSLIETYKEKNKVLEKKIKNTKNYEEEIDIYMYE